MKHLRLAVLVLALAATAARGQYVMDSIDVGGAWVGSLAFNSRMNVIYGASEDGFVFAIDCATNEVISTIPGGGALDVIYDSTDNRAYSTLAGAVLVIDGNTHTALRTIPMPEATWPTWDPMGDRVYVSCTENNSVAVIDCVTDSVVANIAVGAAPIKMHVNPLRRKLYVQNYDAGSISIVDMTTNYVIATVPVGNYVQSGWYDAEYDRYYVGKSDETIVIDGSTDSIRYRIPHDPIDVAYVIGGGVPGLAVIGVYESNCLYVVSRSTGLVKTVTRVGREPEALAWGVGADRLYCANATSDDVTVLTGDGLTVVTTIPVGDCPFVFGYSPVERRLYVGHLNGRWVYVIKDTATGVEEAPEREASSPTLNAEPSVFTNSVRFAGAGSAYGAAELRVHTACGQLVRMLRVNADAAGRWSCTWNGQDEQGKQVPAGVHLLTLVGNERTPVKVVKLR